jgi:hypothetical protein
MTATPATQKYARNAGNPESDATPSCPSSYGQQFQHDRESFGKDDAQVRFRNPVELLQHLNKSIQIFERNHVWAI